MEIQELKSKWWYRLLKVIYIIAIIFSLGTWFSLGYNETNPPLDYFYYNCDNGKQIYESGIPQKTLSWGGTISDYDALKELCGGGYKRINVYEARDWKNLIVGCLYGIIFVWLFFEIIRGIFFYIATGKWVSFKYRKKQ